MSSEDAVREASKQFYAALSRMANGDAGHMADAWSHDDTVTAMHPIGGREEGWGSVGTSFAKVAEIATKGRVEITDQLIRVHGDVAYELGIERGEIEIFGKQVVIDIRVTNIYQREGAGWKMVHHHTDLSPAMLEVLKQS